LEGFLVGALARLAMREKPRLLLDLHGPFLDEMLYYGMFPKKIVLLFKKINLERMIFNYSKYIVASSEGLASNILKTKTKSVVTVIPDFVSLKNFSHIRPFLVPNEPIVVAYAGTLKTYQGIDQLLKVTKKLLATGVNFQLRIIGGLGLGIPHFQGLVSELNIANHVKFTGMLPHLQALEEMNKVDILISPRLRTNVTESGFVSQMPEYMALGKPIISSRISGCEEMLGSNYPGLYEPNSEAELYEIMRSFILDRELREKAATLSKNRGEAWSWEANSYLLTDAYRLINAKYA
jgi:glycosyltransferase involved in cell wall biosynthesis